MFRVVVLEFVVPWIRDQQCHPDPISRIGDRSAEAALRRRARPRLAGARRLLRRAFRRAGFVPGFAHRRTRRRLGHRPPGASARLGHGAALGCRTDGAAVGAVRAKAVAGLPAGQARLREGTGGLRPGLLDRAADGLLQIAERPGRPGAP